MSIVPPGRIVGLDVARCLALVGMIATHVLNGIVDNQVIFTQQIAGGRASSLFAVLAGVSLALMSGGTTPVTGTERRTAAAGLVGRALFIAAAGLILGGFPTGIAVILTYYGALFLLGIPFLGLRSRTLALLSVAWLVAMPVVSHLVRPYLPERSYGSPTVESLADPWRLLTELTFTGYYPAVSWLAYLFAGMAIGRLGLKRTRIALALVGVGSVLAATSWLTSQELLARPGVRETLQDTYTGLAWRGDLAPTLEHGLFGTTPTGSWWWLAVRAPHTATPFDLAHTIGSAVVVIGLCLLLGRHVRRLSAVLFAAGAMTLTLYTAHVFLRMPALMSGDDALTFVRHVLLVLVVGAVLRLVGRRGPLEAAAARMAERAAEAVRPSRG